VHAWKGGPRGCRIAERLCKISRSAERRFMVFIGRSADCWCKMVRTWSVDAKKGRSAECWCKKKVRAWSGGKSRSAERRCRKGLERGAVTSKRAGSQSGIYPCRPLPPLNPSRNTNNFNINWAISWNHMNNPWNDPIDPLVVAIWIRKQLKWVVVIPVLCLKLSNSV
jgi:hypothetical protein